MTVQQGVDFLANRQVGLRYSCAPSLEKMAQDNAPADSGGEGGAAPAAGTLAALLANPSMQAAGYGTVAGGLVGLVAGLRRKKKRRNLLRDMLTGALAGGVGVGGLHLAGTSLMGDFNKDTVDHSTFNLPAGDAKAQAEWLKAQQAAGKSPEEITKFQNEALAKFHKADPKAFNTYVKGLDVGDDSSWISNPQKLVRSLASVPERTGQGYGRLIGGFGGMALGGEEDDIGQWGEAGGTVGSTALGYGLPAYVASAAANKIRTPLDLSHNRLSAIGEAMWGDKSFEMKKGVKSQFPAAKELEELFNKSLGGGQVNPSNLQTIRQGLHGGEPELDYQNRIAADPSSGPRVTPEAARRKLNDLLVSGPEKLPAAGTPGYGAAVDANAARLKARQSFMGFLGELRKAEKTHMKGLEGSTDAKIPFGNIQTPDARLGHIASAVQRGQVPGLNRFTGMNPRVRPHAPFNVKVPYTMRFPKIRGGLGWAAALGTPIGGIALDEYYNRADSSQTYGAGVQDYLKSQAGNE